jgi:Lar family restriction alleviation protein
VVFIFYLKVKFMFNKDTPIENHCCKVMEELKPCPFCGKQPEILKRPASSDGYFCAIVCYCGGYSATAYQFATDKTSADAAYKKAKELWNHRAAPKNKPLTLEQIKQLNLGDTVTIVHSDKITYLDHECFETLYEVWGLADVKDGTVEVYACEPKAGERDG